MGSRAKDHHPQDHIMITPRSACRGQLMLGMAAVACAMSALAGCVGGVDSAQPSGSGGRGDASIGSSSGGITSPPASSGGSSGVLPGGTGGGVSGSGGLSDATGGSGTTPASGGSCTCSAAGRGGGVTNAGSGGVGGAGVLTATGGSTPLPPPVRDTASKLPLSSAPGYTVEGNYAYGPLLVQRLDVIYPASAGPRGTKVLPAVLMFHGGAWIHGYREANGKDHMSTFFNRFLAHGFIVFNAEYRVNNGTSEGAPAPAAVEDALLAAKWCWDRMDYFHGDKTKYVVTGASAGGHLALMVGMTTPAAKLGATSPADYLIAGIVDGYGPADIESELSGVASGWIPAGLPNRAAVAKLVNPMTYVRKDIPPLIVVQGSADGVAPVAHSVHLVANLTAAGADATMHEVPGAGHGFATTTEWLDAEKAMFTWLTARGIGN